MPSEGTIPAHGPRLLGGGGGGVYLSLPEAGSREFQLVLGKCILGRDAFLNSFLARGLSHPEASVQGSCSQPCLWGPGSRSPLWRSLCPGSGVRYEAGLTPSLGTDYSQEWPADAGGGPPPHLRELAWVLFRMQLGSCMGTSSSGTCCLQRLNGTPSQAWLRSLTLLSKAKQNQQTTRKTV